MEAAHATLETLFKPSALGNDTIGLWIEKKKKTWSKNLKHSTRRGPRPSADLQKGMRLSSYWQSGPR